MVSRVIHLAGASLVLSLTSISIAQSAGYGGNHQSGTSSANSSFAVASIRPSKPGGKLSFGTTRDAYDAMNTPLVWIILAAKLDLPPAYWRTDRVLGSPSWVGSDDFDIHAKLDDEMVSAFAASPDARRDSLVKPLLASMLAERCNLRAHTEMRYSKAIGINVTSKRISMKRSTSDRRDKSAIFFGESAVMRPIHIGARSAMEFQNTSMREFAEVLSGLGSGSQPVFVDETNLTGKYDFILYKREEDEVGARATGDPDPASLWDVEALGLKLKTVKVPLPVVVVDHIDYPSRN